MANKTSIFNTKRDGKRDTLRAGTGLPVISQGLDSVRAYQFEVQIDIPGSGPTEILTLAAKQVTAAGFSTEDIEVMRVNDKVFYPGRATPEEVTITFDNFYKHNGEIGVLLWDWFKRVYNPVTGDLGMGSTAATPGGGGPKYKANSMTILSLDGHGNVDYETRLMGVYPKSWKTAEFNYATNDFHTIEVVFRYDFMDHVTV